MSSHSNTTPMILLSNITNLVSVKLDHTNYMLWKFQITSTLKAYKLLDVVDGSYPCPEMYIKDTNGAATSVVNPDFIQWDTKDQALISMISATLSPSALVLVIGQKSAKGVWDTLEKRFTSFSRSNILSLKRDLHSIKKNSDSINVYMQKIKECKDKLEAVGVFVEDEELLHIVLDGLPTEMYPFCTAMRTRNEPIGLEELHVLINAEEKSLKNNSDSSKESMQHLAMLGTGPKSGTGTDDLNWLQRMNVILEIARLLKFLHGQDKPYLVFNINASHIVLNQDFMPKLIDFGLISKQDIGEMSTQKKQITMRRQCDDPYFTLRGGNWETSCEVFSLGVILLGLIAKRTCDMEQLEKPELVLDRLMHVWAKKEYKPQCSLVHKSLQEDWGYNAEDGIAITELGMCCIEFFPTNRPTMKDVVERLESLHIFQRLGDSRPHKRDKRYHHNAM